MVEKEFCTVPRDINAERPTYPSQWPIFTVSRWSIIGRVYSGKPAINMLERQNPESVRAWRSRKFPPCLGKTVPPCKQSPAKLNPPKSPCQQSFEEMVRTTTHKNISFTYFVRAKTGEASGQEGQTKDRCCARCTGVLRGRAAQGRRHVAGRQSLADEHPSCSNPVCEAPIQQGRKSVQLHV